MKAEKLCVRLKPGKVLEHHDLREYQDQLSGADHHRQCCSRDQSTCHSYRHNRTPDAEDTEQDHARPQEVGEEGGDEVTRRRAHEAAVRTDHQ